MPTVVGGPDYRSFSDVAAQLAQERMAQAELNLRNQQYQQQMRQFQVDAYFRQQGLDLERTKTEFSMQQDEATLAANEFLQKARLANERRAQEAEAEDRERQFGLSAAKVSVESGLKYDPITSEWRALKEEDPEWTAYKTNLDLRQEKIAAPLEATKLRLEQAGERLMQQGVEHVRDQELKEQQFFEKQLQQQKQFDAKLEEAEERAKTAEAKADKTAALNAATNMDKLADGLRADAAAMTAQKKKFEMTFSSENLFDKDVQAFNKETDPVKKLAMLPGILKSHGFGPDFDASVTDLETRASTASRRANLVRTKALADWLPPEERGDLGDETPEIKGAPKGVSGGGSGLPPVAISGPRPNYSPKLWDEVSAVLPRAKPGVAMTMSQMMTVLALLRQFGVISPGDSRETIKEKAMAVVAQYGYVALGD